MEPTQDHFPVFETNQVLTSEHLNTVFTYLDEQSRLTRAHLIGIGIVCGLEVELAGTTAAPVIKITKGCGVTSQGFLINVPDSLRLTHYRAGYKIKNQYDAESETDPAAAFTVPGSSPAEQYKLWELFEDGDEPSALALSDGSDLSLDDKAVLLFLELKELGVRNCSPNNCDDKGSEVTATVKPLLIKQADLNKMVAVANGLSPSVTTADLAASLLKKWKLPDLRLPRFDVPNSRPMETVDVYTAFLDVFREDRLATATARALQATYSAFRPLLRGLYPADPFDGFAAKFGFLDRAPTTANQVKFLQYYYDLFDDLLRAYDEFRWKGAELACACCPSEEIFPRHLMLGLLYPDKVTAPEIYWHAFIASPANCCCGERLDEVLLLFQRLVELTLRFTNVPSLPESGKKNIPDPQIRITPSVLGREPLAAKAIPYYYELDGTPPLYELWSPEKAGRHRARHNLGYRSTEYVPAAPDFVTEPLRYDLEPYGFLRIEGHVGKSYRDVLRTLLALKSQYRLPVEFVALRSGEYDDTQTVDASTEPARFQDLETLYDSQREALLRALTESLMSFYDIVIEGAELTASTPKHPLLTKYAPNYQHPNNSLGALFEGSLTRFDSLAYIDVDQSDVAGTITGIYLRLGRVMPGLGRGYFAPAVTLYYLTQLSEALTSSLGDLAFDDFRNKYEDMLALVRFLRSDEATKTSSDLEAFIPRENLIDQFDQLLFACELGPVEATYEEYLRRLRDLRKRQFFAYFLQNHPGIQHKAGVPMGGTFILVYHQEEASDESAFVKRGTGKQTKWNRELAKKIELIMGGKEYASDSEMARDIATLIEESPKEGSVKTNAKADKVIAATAAGLIDGVVIADFYLPYRLSADCAGVQFVLPNKPPIVSVELGCPDADGIAVATITVEGGFAPYEIDIDGTGYEALTETVSLAIGTHILTVRDAEGTLSTPQNADVVPIVIGGPAYTCGSDYTTYTATVAISGGKPPYTVNGVASAETYTTEAISSGKAVVIEVVDAKGCTAEIEVSYTCVKPCTLPCDGAALDRGHIFWLPEPGLNTAYAGIEFVAATFKYETAQGVSVDLSTAFLKELRAVTLDEWNKDFVQTVSALLGKINQSTAEKAGPILSYKQPKLGELGILGIEHFECLGFRIEVSTTFRRPEKQEAWRFIYDPDGTGMQAPGRQEILRVPAFGGVRMDKCEAESPRTPICAKAPDIQLTIDQEVSLTTQKAQLTAKLSGADADGATLFWEAPGAMPAIADAVNPTFIFDSPGSKLVLLIAFDQNGCSVSETAILNVQPKVPPAVDVVLGCPDANGIAAATVTVSGGVAPYEIDVDGKGYTAFTGTLSLASGTRTLTVRDAEGMLSTPQKVDVVPIIISTPTYLCGSDYTTYKATVAISGGTPPYSVNGETSDGAYTSKAIASGEVYGIEVADANGCTANIELEHVCIKPCTFTVALGCPSANGIAVAIISVDGGVAPYGISVDNNAYVPLTGSVALAKGTHTLVVRDSVGTVTSSRTVNVDPIVIGEPSYECSPDAKTYTATISISGGTAPYMVNGEPYKNPYVTKAIASGENYLIEVVDAKKCSASIEVSHTCPQAICTLPCDGVAVSRGYRFWLPLPGESAQYTSVAFESATFDLEVAPGESIDMSAAFLKELRSVPLDSWNKDLPLAVSTLLDTINKAVASKVDFTMNCGWVSKYSEFGFLEIEHFGCLGFQIDVVTTFMRPTKSETWRFTYDPKGTTIFQPGLQTAIRIPAFGGDKIDKCNPDSPPTPLCEKTPDINMTVTQEPIGLTVKLTAKLSGIDADTAVLIWDAPGATPSMASTAVAGFKYASYGTKTVRLTAVARNGCTVAQTVTVNLG